MRTRHSIRKTIHKSKIRMAEFQATKKGVINTYKVPKKKEDLTNALVYLPLVFIMFYYIYDYITYGG